MIKLKFCHFLYYQSDLGLRNSIQDLLNYVASYYQIIQHCTTTTWAGPVLTRSNPPGTGQKCVGTPEEEKTRWCNLPLHLSISHGSNAPFEQLRADILGSAPCPGDPAFCPQKHGEKLVVGYKAVTFTNIQLAPVASLALQRAKPTLLSPLAIGKFGAWFGPVILALNKQWWWRGEMSHSL